MSEDLLKLRKACLLTKLLSGKAEPKKINAKAIETLFKSASVVKHIPFDEGAIRLVTDDLVREGTIRLEEKGKATTYFANDQTVGALAALSKWPPPPPPPPPPVIDAKVKSYVLLSLFIAAPTATSDSVKPSPAAGVKKPDLPRILVSMEHDGLIARESHGGSPADAATYRLTERGRRHIVEVPQHSRVEFRFNGDTVNSLIQCAAKAAGTSEPAHHEPRVQHVATTSGSVSDDQLIAEAKDLMREVGRNDLLAIFELRRLVKQKYGEHAARHDQFDPQLKRMRGNRLRLVAIGDRSKATPDQLQDGVPGVEELFFYVRDLR